MTSPDGICNAVAGGVPKVEAPQIFIDDEGTSVGVIVGLAVELSAVGDDEGICVEVIIGLADKASSVGEDESAPAEEIDDISVEVSSAGDDQVQAEIKNIESSISITSRKICLWFILVTSGKIQNRCIFRFVIVLALTFYI